MSAPAGLRRTPGVLAEELDGRVLLLAPGQAHVLALDEVASAVWHLLADEPSPDALAEALAQRYGVPAEQVAADLQPALGVLRQHGVLA